MTASHDLVSEETPGLNRRDRERLARRSEMLRAARAVFAEHGFAGATLEEIAARAEFGKGTLYNYFPDGKDEILFAVFEEIYNDLVGLIQEAFPPLEKSALRTQTRARFTDFIGRCFSYYESQRDLFLILVKEAHRMCLSEQGDRAAVLLSHRARVTEGLAVHVQMAIDAGAIRPFEARATADMILGNINGMEMHRALQRSMEQSSWDAAASTEFLSAFLFDGLLTPEGNA